MSLPSSDAIAEHIRHKLEELHGEVDKNAESIVEHREAIAELQYDNAATLDKIAAYETVAGDIDGTDQGPMNGDTIVPMQSRIIPIDEDMPNRARVHHGYPQKAVMRVMGDENRFMTASDVISGVHKQVRADYTKNPKIGVHEQTIRRVLKVLRKEGTVIKATYDGNSAYTFYGHRALLVQLGDKARFAKPEYAPSPDRMEGVKDPDNPEFELDYLQIPLPKAIAANGDGSFVGDDSTAREPLTFKIRA